MNNPAYKKKQITIVLTICVLIVVLVFAVLFGIKYKNVKAYEKDLSSVFGITPNMDMEDIIEFEASQYGHTEYNIEQVQDGKKTRLEFGPYIKSKSDIDYKHYYFFYTDTELLSSVRYSDIGVIGNKDSDAKCKHIYDIKNAALSLYSDWDKNEYDGLFLTMYGNIDGIKCHIKYEAGSDKAISLFIDREK